MFDDLLKTIRPIVWREEKTFRERCNYELHCWCTAVFAAVR